MSYTKEEEAKIRADALRSINRLEASLADHVAILAASGLDGLLRYRAQAIMNNHGKDDRVLIDAIGRFVYGEKYDREVEKGEGR
jgi:hypothetical protein